MPMIWTDQAIADVEQLHQRLTAVNPRQAAEAMGIVRAVAAQLEQNPTVGPSVAMDGAPAWLRQWPFAVGSMRFTFSYRQDGGDTVVLTVRMMHDNDESAG
jgi:plasmid stabilization system protein ParE